MSVATEFGAFGTFISLILESDLQLLTAALVLKAEYFSPWKGEQQMFKLDIGWPKTPEDFTGQTFCVAVDSLHGLVYVGQRGDNVPKVLVFSKEGYFLHSWNDTVEMPHGIFVWNTETGSSVWITDVGTGKYGHTVKQYSPLGKLLQVLGTPGNAGSSLIPLQFDQPAEIFVEETGEVYVVDGDGGMNNRLLKLSDDYKEIWLTGTNGSGIGQFKIPHSVTVDAFGRVWVADRGNKRIQVFDKVTGEWLGSWSGCFSEDGPYSVRFTADYKYLIVAQLNINRLAILAAPPVGSIGDCVIVHSVQLADETKPHLVDVDMKSGAVYVAEIGAQQSNFSLDLVWVQGMLGEESAMSDGVYMLCLSGGEKIVHQKPHEQRQLHCESVGVEVMNYTVKENENQMALAKHQHRAVMHSGGTATQHLDKPVT
ncbi:hypothetical protein IHE44_0005411 [Lamprotornis superbus]|uniref:NHL repeat-containing protein 3 n=1 Tax=Lamprotornis superbus TaxID=245042 RepID=A0A835NXK5_9PASS|nr:hypothetical protein IHE44_0005411 [Lamprotornis superbus]